MKGLGKFLLWGGAILGIVLITGVSLTIGWRPFLGARARSLTDRKFQPTRARLARGNYLANNVMGCTDCHTEHDFKVAGAPVLETKLAGGEVFPALGLPGNVIAPNLTPDLTTGAGSWSDDQFARAIREGIGHDGRTLFPLMPYQNFRVLSDEDLASIVVYLRSLPAIRNSLAKTEIIFPVKFLINSAPEPLTEAVPEPDLSITVKRGQYLVAIAACVKCHTPEHNGKPDTVLAFGGGFEFKGPLPTVTSANITPDETGISYYDENLFLDVMHTGKVKARELSSVMPWIIYKNMTDDDLKAMFAYLRTVKPVHHRVDNTEPPTACKICKTSHGAGDQN